MRRRAFWIAPLAALAVAIALITAASGAPAPVEGEVYRLQVTATTAQGAESWTEWVAPVSGRWRIEADRTYVYTGGAYVVLTGGDSAYVRTGSAAFLGALPSRAVSRDALRTYLAGGSAGVGATRLPDGRTELGFRRGTISYVAVIEEKISAAEAEARKLFGVPLEQVTSSTTERRVGERPAQPLPVYWLGRTYFRWKAIAAVEQYAGPSPDQRSRELRPRVPVTSYVVFYELASARGKSSALPGERPPAGEIRVLSQSVTSWVARRAIEAYNGRNGGLRYRPWPRTTLTLSSGEKAVLIPDLSEGATAVRRGFAVITKTALVNVSGSFKLAVIPAIAQGLRPLAPSR